MEFQSKQLYPKPEVKEPNIEYAKLLLQDYAGNISEESAVHLYSFQNFILSEQYPQIANDLFHISVVEMHHLKLLGKTIHLLGLTPEFMTYQSDSDTKHYWSSSFLNYSTSLKDILTWNMEKEEQAINRYISHYNMIEDPYIQQLLLRIIEDEKIHLEYFQKQLIILNQKK